MRDTTRAAQGKQLFPQRNDVVGQPRGFEGWVQAADQPGILRGDPGRAVVSVASLRLNAADGEQRFSPHVDQIAAEPETEDRSFWKPESAGSDKDDLFMQSFLVEDLLHTAEANFERERDVVGEHQRSGSRAAFAAVDGNKVDAAAPS